MTRQSRPILLLVALLPLAILGAQKGDVSLDGVVDTRDALLLERAVRGETALTPEAEEAADLAPLGPPLGDALVGPADLRVLFRALEGDDLDGDGLPAHFEARAGTFPFAADSDGNDVTDDLEDSDGDGIPNGVEYLLGTHPGNIDSDGDGIPDWAEGAEEPPQGVATNLEQAVSFLYEGPAAIQTGVAPGTIEPLRVAVLRGVVTTPAGAGIPGVTISVKDHPELGETRTRGDGTFDVAVNGGGVLTLEYEGPGFLPVQRQVTAPWQDFASLPDVVLVPVDSAVTNVTLGAGAWQVVEASAVTDAFGTRQPKLFVPPGVGATFLMPGGGTQAPTEPLALRITEYTVGESGPAAMPGLLPPSSAYTYAIEVSADEAVEVGANHIRFRSPGGSEPRPVLYLENFLGFPVGMPVPWGSYDREKAGWSAEESGRVVALVDAGGGAVGLDVTGDGAADPGEYAALEVTAGELEALDTSYTTTPVELWRVPLAQASPGDGNLAPVPPPDAVTPETPAPNEEPPPDCSPECGSILRAERRAVGEAVDLVGMPFSLHYSSDRTPGYGAARRLVVPMRRASVPASLVDMRLRIEVGGVTTHVQKAPGDTEPYVFDWIGQSAYGQELKGRQPITIALSYRYPFAYRWTRTFNQVDDPTVVSGGAGRNVGALTSEWRGRIGAFDARDVGLGGWTLGIHHTYDPYAKILYRGDGTQESVKNLPDVITTYLSGPPIGCPLCNGLVVATGPDGAVYTGGGSLVHRLLEDGSAIRVAGGGPSGATGDGLIATEARLGTVTGLAVREDGTLYIASDQQGFDNVRKVTLEGLIYTVAGTGEQGYSPDEDGGPATSARLLNPRHLALAPDGTLYIADSGSHRVRKVEPNGTIRTVAGNGGQVYGSDPALQENQLATTVGLGLVTAVDVGPDGSLYLVSRTNDQKELVRRVTPDGLIRTVAGRVVTSEPCAAEGEEATRLCLLSPSGLDVTADGSLLFSDRLRRRVWKVGVDGLAATVAGNGLSSASAPLGDGGPASAGALGDVADIALGAAGELYVISWGRLRKVTPALPAYGLGDLFVPSRDGSELYHFDSTGRHLETLEARTRHPLWTFAYTEEGALERATDGDGDEYLVERNGAGEPVGLLAELGNHRTELEIDANGWLETIRNPASEAHAFIYSAEGLLASYTAPAGGGARTYSYDADGRLDVASDPAGGSKTFTSPALLQGPASLGVRVETGEGRITTYEVARQPDRDEVRHTRLHVGSEETLDTKTVREPDGTVTRTDPDGTVTTVVEGPDPRFGMMAPLPSSFIVTTPASRVFSGSYTRSDPDLGAGEEVTEQTDTLVLHEPGTAPPGGRTYTQVYAQIEGTGPEVASVTTTTPEGRVIADTLDVQGRLLSRQVGSLEPVRFAYDASGRLETIRQGTGAAERETVFSYDPVSGFLASIEDPLDRLVTIDSHDAAGRPTQQTLPGNRVVGFGWDANGNLASLTPPGKPAHGFAYTPVDLESEYTPPVVDTNPPWLTETIWDGDRRLERVERPDATSIDLAYETPSGRLESITIPEGTIDLSYHPTSGQLESLTAAGGGALDLAWDGFLLESQTWSGPVAGSVGFDYESPGLRLVTETVNGAHAVAFAYDDDGLLTEAGALDLTPHPSHGLLQDTTLGVVTTAYTYTPFGELENDSARISGSPVYGNAYVVRDELGRIEQKVETLQGATTTWDYAYDPAGRLDTVTRTPGGGSPVLVADHAYDANGNRLCTNEVAGSCPVSAVYDEQDRLVTDEAGRGYAYSEAGELERVSEGGTHTLYRTDALGALREVCLGSSDPDTCTGGTEIEYEIDPLGRRIGKRIDSVLQKGFLWSDALRVVAELDGSGAVVSRFVYGTRVNVPEYMEKGGVTYRILTDHLGSVRLVVNAATGAIAQRIDYDAWGVPTLVTGPADFQPFGFAGGLYDPDTGLVRFGARDYDARTGRWTSKDPIRFEGADGNLFAYAANDAINGVDPTGHEWLSGGWRVGGGGGATKGRSSGSYFRPTTGDFGSYVTSDSGFGTPGISGGLEFAFGSGSSPKGVTYGVQGELGYGGFVCGVAFGANGDGDWAFKATFGFGSPRGIGVGASDTDADHGGNAYREVQDAITGRLRPPYYPR